MGLKYLSSFVPFSMGKEANVTVRTQGGGNREVKVPVFKSCQNHILLKERYL
jgi:hypothetical protein